VGRSVESPQGTRLPSAPSNREIEDEDDDEDEDEAPQGTGLPAAFSLSRPTYSASPAAPIHATAHFIAFFVAHFVVYASSQDFVETALGQPYLNTKGAFMPVLYSIPGFSTHPDHIQTHTIFPHKPGSAVAPLPGLWGNFSWMGNRGHAQVVEREEPTKWATKRKRQSVRRSVRRSVGSPQGTGIPSAPSNREGLSGPSLGVLCPTNASASWLALAMTASGSSIHGLPSKPNNASASPTREQRDLRDRVDDQSLVTQCKIIVL
jgi:hypothetical protein